MAYFLTMTCGDDEGRSFRIEPGESIIGRSPSNTIVLIDDSVAWEHALVRDDGGRLHLRNLAALGTRVKGRRVTGEVNLRDGDEIALSDRCRLTVRRRAGVARRPASRPLVLIGVASILLVVVVSGTVLFGILQPTRRPISAAHWRQGYHRLEERLADWDVKGWLPSEVVVMFRDAWRLEQSGSAPAAAERWANLRSLLLVMRVPGGRRDVTMAEAAGSSSKALRVLMGHDLRTGNNDYQWSTDEIYADAFVWFVNNRARITRDQVEKERP